MLLSTAHTQACCCLRVKAFCLTTSVTCVMGAGEQLVTLAQNCGHFVCHVTDSRDNATVMVDTCISNQRQGACISPRYSSTRVRGTSPSGRKQMRPTPLGCIRKKSCPTCDAGPMLLAFTQGEGHNVVWADLLTFQQCWCERGDHCGTDARTG